jgi:hypothetical protein
MGNKTTTDDEYENINKCCSLGVVVRREPCGMYNNRYYNISNKVMDYAEIF